MPMSPFLDLGSQTNLLNALHEIRSMGLVLSCMLGKMEVLLYAPMRRCSASRETADIQPLAFLTTDSRGKPNTERDNASRQKMSAASNPGESAYEDVASNQSEDAAGGGPERSAPESGPGEEDGDSEPTSDIGTRKRRKNGDPQPTRAKRLKGLYRDEYRQLHNSTIQETISYLPNGNPGSLEPSQVGVSRWTVSEKQLLFSAIEKHGKDNVPKIAAIVETKSEPEIRDLLLLLQEGYAELHINAEYPRAPAVHEITAAYEVSEDCCKSLESAADALAKYQNSWDAKQERKKHGNYWLLTSDVATAFDKAVEAEEEAIEAAGNLGHANEGDDGENLTEQDTEDAEDDLQRAKAALTAVPAARLLWLSNWFELSNRVFANAGGPREDENWRSIAEQEEELGIFHTAFSDFHRLVVSVTQRLVAASLNQAASRLRAKDVQRENKGIAPLVRRQDVLAALKILDMPQSSRSFWVKAPRRCGVIVQRKGGAIDYDEAERILRGEPSSVNTASTQNRRTAIGGATTANVNSTDFSELEVVSDDDGPDPQETYAELLDIRQSNLEEEKLWKLLGQSPPPTHVTRSVELPQQPSRERKTYDELLDWRGLVDFKAEWERYGKPINPASPKNTDSSNIARPEDVPEPAQSPAPTVRATSEALDRNSISSISDSEVRRRSSSSDALRMEEEVVEDDGSVYEVDAEPGGGARPTNLPIRRVLAPRRARDAATSSMGELPPYPEDDDDSSGDDYDGR